MKSFDMKRFARTFRWTFQTELTGILSGTCGITFGFLVCVIAQQWPVLKSGGDITIVEKSGVISSCYIAYLVYLVIGGTYIMGSMKTSKSLLAFKMLPATDAEKFIVRFIFATAVWAVMGLVALCVGDVLRMLMCVLAGVGNAGSFIPDVLSSLFRSDGRPFGAILAYGEVNWSSTLLFYSLLVWAHSAYMLGRILLRRHPFVLISCVMLLYAWGFWVHSLYILGGAFFRRHQFVLTSLVHLVLIMVFTPLLVHFVKTVDNAFFNHWKLVLAWSGAAVFAALGVLDWWLSYKIFRRMQVVNNKWVNL